MQDHPLSQPRRGAGDHATRSGLDILKYHHVRLDQVNILLFQKGVFSSVNVLMGSRLGTLGTPS